MWKLRTSFSPRSSAPVTLATYFVRLRPTTATTTTPTVPRQTVEKMFFLIPWLECALLVRFRDFRGSIRTQGGLSQLELGTRVTNFPFGHNWRDKKNYLHTENDSRNNNALHSRCSLIAFHSVTGSRSASNKCRKSQIVRGERQGDDEVRARRLSGDACLRLEIVLGFRVNGECLLCELSKKEISWDPCDCRSLRDNFTKNRTRSNSSIPFPRNPAFPNQMTKTGKPPDSHLISNQPKHNSLNLPNHPAPETFHSIPTSP